MNVLDFIGFLRNYCTDNGIYFCAGENDYINATTDGHIYKELDLIMCVNLSLSPQFNDNNLESVVYNGTIAIGRKKEENTESNLDEFFIQKYDNRLLDLSNILVDFFQSLSCEEGADIQSCNLQYQLNKTDANIDFVASTISIKFDNEE